MKLGIMQPYYFPYLGYFDLINRTDFWVVFDTVQYRPKTWTNRNRILHPTNGWQYITVPVNKHSGEGRIADATVIDADAAHKKLLGQVEHYRKGRAPYFKQVTEIVNKCYFNLPSNKLRDLNIRALEVVCAYLELDFQHEILSEKSIELPEITHPGQWALEISDIYDADEYINPPAGKSIFREDEFAQRDIKLSFTELINFHYPCGQYAFIEHLSILDVLMWNDPEKIKVYLDGINPANIAV